MPRIVPIAIVWLCGFAGLASAQTDNPVAKIFDAGVAAYDAGHFDKAYALWVSIDDKDTAAMRNVGILLRKGQGVKKDPVAAEKMFERAARVGLVTAQADLADMLLKGEAGPPDPKRALPLLKAAAAANHPIAQFELAQMYESGGLVPKDLNIRNLYAAAARHGMKEAKDRLATLGRAAPNASGAAAMKDVTAPVPKLSAAAEAPMDGRKAAGGAYALQIGAYKSLTDTDAAWKSYQAKYATLLSGHSSDVQRVDLAEKGAWYRLRIGGFDSRDAASALCDQLKKQGSDCFLSK